MAPSRQGLYNPAFEHDACGVAMVADMHGRRSRDIVDKAITALLNLEHRGAQGAEPNTGDGAGILLQVPDDYFRAVCKMGGFALPEPGSYATGIAFLPQSSKDAAIACESVGTSRQPMKVRPSASTIFCTDSHAAAASRDDCGRNAMPVA